MKIKLVLFVAIIAGLVALFTVSFREKQFSIKQEACYNEDENNPKPKNAPIPTGVKSLLSLKAFPNTADDYVDVAVNIEDMRDMTLKVMDLTGKVVITKAYGYLTQGQHIINLETSQIKTGIYVLVGTATGTNGDVNYGKI